MKLSEFEYNLPPELIAQHPLNPRDQARLLVIDRKTQEISHHYFFEINRFLPLGSLIVLNDSKVIPARLFGKRMTGGEVEIFLLNKLSDGYSYEALIKPLGRLKINERIIFNGGKVYAELVDPVNKIVRFNQKNIEPVLEDIGHMPLPPYIKRSDTAQDRDDYQTVYAKHEGSVAAPTAGLHFTKELIAKLKEAGHGIEKLTLHVNYATFKPVQAEDVTEHHMHEETYSVPKEVWDDIQKARNDGRKIVAVGTTSCRVLETLGQQAMRGHRTLQGQTDIFIYPGYSFTMTDILITNFHLPKSTLLMLVYAFGGIDLMRRAYAEAIREKYRFYSYGDAMIIV